MLEKVPYGFDSPLLKGICKEFDPDMWFPEEDEASDQDPYDSDLAWMAREICSQCPVKEECLSDAILNDQKWGIWGGQSPQERKRLEELVRD